MLTSDHALFRIPSSMDVRQQRLLNGVRICIDQYLGAHERVWRVLDRLGPVDCELAAGEGAMIMGDAWSVVRSGAQLCRLARQLEMRSSGDGPKPEGAVRLLDSLDPLSGFQVVRNDEQHIEERLDKAKFSSHPDWGTLCWLYMSAPGQGSSRLMYLGQMRGDVSALAINPIDSGVVDRNGVQRIELHSFNGKVDLMAGADAVVEYATGLDQILSPQFAGRPHRGADFLLTIEFGVGEPIAPADVDA